MALKENLVDIFSLPQAANIHPPFPTDNNYMCVKKSLLKHVLSDSLLLRFKLLAKKDNCTLHTVDKVRKLGGKIRRWRRDLALSHQHLLKVSNCCCATVNL